MRKNIDLDPDVAVAVEAVQQTEGASVSEAVNLLIRRAMAADGPTRFVQRVHPGGLHIDVLAVAEAVDVLEGPDAR